MELAELHVFEPEIFEPVVFGVGEASVRKVKPYIKGHVTDGSSTFTFTVNGSESVTVPVDANGNWKWVVDRTITSLYRAFYQNSSIDYLEVNIPNSPNLENLQEFCKYIGYNGTEYLQDSIIINIKKLDTSNVTNFIGSFHSGGIKNANLYGLTSTAKVTDFSAAFNMLNAEVIDLRPIDVSGCTKADAIQRTFWWSTCKNVHLGKFLSNPLLTTNIISGRAAIENLTADIIKVSVNWLKCPLTEQSVVNIFNAVAADGITLTFHATVYAMIEEQLEIEGSPIYEAYWNSDYDFNYASA